MASSTEGVIADSAMFEGLTVAEDKPSPHHFAAALKRGQSPSLHSAAACTRQDLRDDLIGVA